MRIQPGLNNCCKPTVDFTSVWGLSAAGVEGLAKDPNCRMYTHTITRVKPRTMLPASKTRSREKDGRQRTSKEQTKTAPATFGSNWSTLFSGLVFLSATPEVSSFSFAEGSRWGVSNSSGNSHSLVELVPVLCFPLSFSGSWCPGSCAVSDAAEGDEDGADAEFPRGFGKRSFFRAVLIGESGLSISKALKIEMVLLFSPGICLSNTWILQARCCLLAILNAFATSWKLAHGSQYSILFNSMQSACFGVQQSNTSCSCAALMLAFNLPQSEWKHQSGNQEISWWF